MGIRLLNKFLKSSCNAETNSFKKLENKKIAIEHNGIIISKINYKKKCLKNNDNIEIVHFIGGG